MKLRKKIISVLSAAACAVSFCAGTVNAVTLDQPAITGSSVKINVDEESFNVYSAGETSWRSNGITVTMDGEEAEISADDLKFTLDGEAVTPKSLYAGTSDEDYNGEYTLEVSYMDSEPVEYKAMIGQYGDVTLDRKIDVCDVMALMKNLLNEEEFPLSALQHELGNVEYDNDFNMIDVAKLIEYILGRMSADNLGPESSVAIWPEMTEDYSDYSAGRARIECASVATFLGERVIVPVYLDTYGEKIDAVAAGVKYDKNYLTLLDICEPEEVGMRSGVSNGRLDTNPERGTFIILSDLSEDIAINPSKPIVCCVFEVRDYVREGTRFDIEIVNTINERNSVEVAAVQQPGEKSKYLMTEVRNGSILVEYKPVTTPSNTTVQTTTS